MSAVKESPRMCTNGPDEYGDYPCDPKGYFGVAECQVCGWIGAWDRSKLGPPPNRFVSAASNQEGERL